ncbi:MAG: DUF58 domain-containing protein [Anaerolineae bacterium]
MRRNWIIVSILLVVALSEALATGQALFFNLTYLLTALLVVSYFWSQMNVSNLQIVRQTRSMRSQVGEAVEERFLVRNKGILPKLWVEVRDHSNLPGHRASWVVTALGAHETRGWAVRTICQQRGRFTLGPISVISSDPFGLFERRKHIPASSSVVVYPLTVDLPYFVLPSGELPGGGAMRRRTHYITTNVSSIRDYFPGDSFNRIHWPSTARTGRLMVKEFELDPTGDVWLFLDMQGAVQAERLTKKEADELPPLWPSRPTLPPSTEEYVVSIAASLARHLLSRNRAVGLIAYGQRREALAADRGERQLTKIMETLAVIRALGTIPMAQILAAEGKGLGRNTSIIIITPSDDTQWVDSLRDLRRRGIRGMGIVLDTASFGRPGNVQGVRAALQQSGIASYVVHEGDSLAAALSIPGGELS